VDPKRDVLETKDPNTGWGINSNGFMLKTIDAGETWVKTYYTHGWHHSLHYYPQLGLKKSVTKRFVFNLCGDYLIYLCSLKQISKLAQPMEIGILV